MDLRWNDWNIEHLARHSIRPEEAEWVIGQAKPPYPEARADDKWLVQGHGLGGRLLQVIFIMDEDGTAFVIHARALTDAEKHRLRRRQRR